MKKIFKRGSYLYYATANGMFYFSWGMFACVISIYLAGIKCSATEISLITSASSLFAMVSQPVCGYLADRFRSPKMVAITTGVLALFFGILFAYTKNFIFLFLLNGFTQGSLNGITALSDRLATASPYPFGSIRLWGSVFYAFAAQLSGYVYDNVSPVANYYIFGVGVVLMIIAFIGMFDAKPKVKDHNEKVTTKEVIKVLWDNKPFMMFVLIYILFQGPANTNGIYMPLLIKDLGGTTTLVGTTLLFSTLFEIPTILFSDRIMKKISYRNLMIFACVLTLIRYLWYASCPNPNMIMVMFFFQGLTTIVFTLVVVRIILELVDEKYVNSAYGISSMLARGLSALIFQISSGYILDNFKGNLGYTIVYLFLGSSMIVAGVLSYCFKMPKKDT